MAVSHRTQPAHVLVTGASSGLGRALALHFAAQGRHLSLNGRDADRLAAVADACRAAGATVTTAAFDLRDAQATAAWVRQVEAIMPVDLAIAAAGLGGQAALAPKGGENAEAAAALMATNVLGLVHVIAPLGQAMARRGGGHLVLVGSIQGAIGLPQSPAYSASKAAVCIYGDGLRRLLAADGVGVTIALPGFVDTPMSQSLTLPRPFCWPADRAAARIARDAARGQRYSVFPMPLRLAIGLARLCPAPVLDLALAIGLRLTGPAR